MRIIGETVRLFLSQDAHEVLHSNEIEVPEDFVLPVRVADSEDLGLWIVVYRHEIAYNLLLR